jgi:hypothetical protein
VIYCYEEAVFTATLIGSGMDGHDAIMAARSVNDAFASFIMDFEAKVSLRVFCVFFLLHKGFRRGLLIFMEGKWATMENRK